jgi:tripartite ATP-independent transporter DctP family solute receptor
VIRQDTSFASWSRLALLLVVTLALVACQAQGSPTDSQPGASQPEESDQTADCESVDLTAGHDSSEEHPYHAGLTAFADTVSESTDGRVTVEIFPSAQLGEEPEMVEGLALGTVDLVVASTPTLTTFSPEMGLLDLPFLAEDLETNYRMLDGAVGDELAGSVEGPTEGRILAWFYAGQRSVWNSVRPVTVPEDLEGLKIRVQESPVQVATFNAFGAQAVPMTFGELYQALETGVVDGADNDPVDVLVEHFYEVTEFYSFTGHRYVNSPLMISAAVFDSLCEADQDAILTAAEAAQEVERETEEGLVQDAVDELETLGLVFNEVPDKAPFQELSEPVYEQFEDEIGPELIQLAIDS